jgi:hypothetical protein
MDDDDDGDDGDDDDDGADARRARGDGGDDGDDGTTTNRRDATRGDRERERADDERGVRVRRRRGEVAKVLAGGEDVRDAARDRRDEAEILRAGHVSVSQRRGAARRTSRGVHGDGYRGEV